MLYRSPVLLLLHRRFLIYSQKVPNYLHQGGYILLCTLKFGYLLELSFSYLISSLQICIVFYYPLQAVLDPNKGIHRVYNSALVSWIIASVTSGFLLIDINNIILVLRILIILLSSFVLYFVAKILRNIGNTPFTLQVVSSAAGHVW